MGKFSPFALTTWHRNGLETTETVHAGDPETIDIGSEAGAEIGTETGDETGLLGDALQPEPEWMTDAEGVHQGHHQGTTGFLAMIETGDPLPGVRGDLDRGPL